MTTTVARKKTTRKGGAKPARRDRVLESVRVALSRFQLDYPKAKIDSYRQSKSNIRFRIIDDSFAGQSVKARHQRLWKVLGSLSLEDRNQVTFMVLLTSDELSESITNYEYENPSWTENES